MLLTGVLLTGCGRSGERTAEGMALVESQSYTEALAVFDEAESLGENARLIARGRGIANMGLTDYEQAITYFTEALSTGDGLVQAVDYDLNYYLAAAYVKNGEPAKAKEVYNAILALAPKEVNAYFLRGTVLLSLGSYEEAKADFDCVVKMTPKDYDRLIEIYQELAAYGYKEVGQEYLQAALAADDSMSAYDSGRIYYYLGEYQRAYLALEEAKDKGGAESYLYLGKAYEATGDYNYASSVYNSYLSKQGDDAKIYNQLGICELQKGDYQKALEAFQAGLAMENASNRQTLAFNEIVAYEYLENYDHAEALIRTYLKNYPDDAAAIREEGFLSTR